MCMLLFTPLSKTDEQHKFALFYWPHITMLHNGFLMDFHWKGWHNNVTAWFVNHFDNSIQLSAQNNIILQWPLLIVT